MDREKTEFPFIIKINFVCTSFICRERCGKGKEGGGGIIKAQSNTKDATKAKDKSPSSSFV